MHSAREAEELARRIQIVPIAAADAIRVHTEMLQMMIFNGLISPEEFLRQNDLLQPSPEHTCEPPPPAPPPPTTWEGRELRSFDLG